MANQAMVNKAMTKTNKILDARFFQELASTAKKQGRQIFAGAGVITRNGKALLARRKPEDSRPGVYEMPKGRIEENETIDNGMIREVLEETGLKVKKILRYLGSYDFLNTAGEKVRQFNFLVRVEAFAPIILAEHDDYQWVDKAELEKINTSDDIRKIVKLALE